MNWLGLEPVAVFCHAFENFFMNLNGWEGCYLGGWKGSCLGSLNRWLWSNLFFNCGLNLAWGLLSVIINRGILTHPHFIAVFWRFLGLSIHLIEFLGLSIHLILTYLFFLILYQFLLYFYVIIILFLLVWRTFNLKRKNVLDFQIL